MESKQMTPMERQYWTIKKEVPDSILFFRLGDFYEMFGDDAVEASEILNIALTSRNKNSENPLPMCGIPFHSSEGYLAKLTKAGKKVAIAEQVSDPKAPGIVERKVVRIITPGTTFSESVLDAKLSNYIASFFVLSGRFCTAFCEVTVGEFFLIESETFEEAVAHIRRYCPAEVVVSPDHFDEYRDTFSLLQLPLSRHFLPNSPQEFLQASFEVQSLKAFEIQGSELMQGACSLLLSFVCETQKMQLSHISPPKVFRESDFLPLDPETIKNLEIFYGSNGEYSTGLLSLLDKTKTAMGGRMLRSRLLAPFKDKEKLGSLHHAVQELLDDDMMRAELGESLSQISDLERIMARISSGRASLRDFLQLRSSLKAIRNILVVLQKMDTTHARDIQNVLRRFFKG